jgi:hypothetical protein
MVLMGAGAAYATPADAESCPNSQFRTGISAHLPDCRAYEQVSPVAKNGADAIGPLQHPAQAAVDGNAVVFMSENSFADSPGSELPNAYFASRATTGWQTSSLTPPSPRGTPPGGSFVVYGFAPDLSKVVVKVSQPLTPNAFGGVYNLYLSDPQGGGYSLINAATPTVLPLTSCVFCFQKTDVPTFAGASTDFSHVIFEANDSLTAGAPAGGVENLYESAEGEVRLVGVLPDDTIAPAGATAGAGIGIHGTQNVSHAISRDGSHVLFEAAADGGEPDPAQGGLTELYDRVNGISKSQAPSTIEVSAPADGAEPSRCETKEGICSPGAAQFWAASADGAKVLFTSKAALTASSNTGRESHTEEEIAEKEEREESEEKPVTLENPGNDLYEYELAGAHNGGVATLRDLAVDQKGVGANVLGVVGASEDGSYVYFVATGQLVNGKGVEGEPNLYVWHEGESGVRFIATLQGAISGEEGQGSAGDTAVWTAKPSESEAYVTPDGRHLAFMSVMPLDEQYDNHDQTTGKLDSEVYAYSAEDARTICVSCDRNGARPVGNAFIGATLAKRIGTQFYQPRTLSDDGRRLFFSSPDPLVSGAASPHVKVYEYENGAPQLISSGLNGTDDVFLDASPTGDDVFMATADQLVASDGDANRDVYDARIGGGFAVPAASIACKEDACQGAPSSAPVFASPSSTTVVAGTPPPGPRRSTPAATVLRCKHGFTRRKVRGKLRCVKSKRRVGHGAPRGRRSSRAGASSR